MTAPLRGTPRLAAIPASQNTAPVAEFRCLFTHDLRRKQKRWQDGYLKFHSFNSRVIVYDASRFLVGETYYKDSNELQDGDELTLDKGVMVTVAEAIGITHTDLTPLFERKAKDSPQRNIAAIPHKPFPSPTVSVSKTLQAASQLRHKSLNTLLGTPKGPIGKAVPMRSPFEERVEKENQNIEERATKRQKTTHEPPIQRYPGSIAAKHIASRKAPLPFQRPSHAHPSVVNQRPRTIPPGATVISLSSSADHLSSDITLPSPPSKPGKLVLPSGAASPSVRKMPLSHQSIGHPTPELPRGKVPVPQVKARQTTQPPPQPSSPPISASNRIMNVDFAVQPLSSPPKDPSSAPSPPQRLPPLQNRKTKSLRLSKGIKRGMLLCQSAPKQQQATLGELTACIAKAKEGMKDASMKGSDTVSDGTSFVARNEPTIGRNGQSLQCSLQISDDMELVHGLMDEQLRVTPSPPGLCEPAKSKPPVVTKPMKSGPATTEKVSKKSRSARESRPADIEPKKKKAKYTQTKEATARPRARKKDAEAPGTDPSCSPSPASLLNAMEVFSKSTTAAPSDPFTKRPRGSSTSVSSTKAATLSTGGFQKKVKRSQAQTKALPDVHQSTVTLPPHPLRSSKNGPLMSTTELSALLQKGPKSMRLEDDPIEDGSQGDNTSPNRSLKRSRSENDAQIPSTSDEWEQRNLTKDPEPADTAKPAQGSETVTQKSKTGLAALVRKTDPRRKFQRTQSLSTDTDLLNVEGSEMMIPLVDDDVGPWSTEAFDLFDWRPPGMGCEDKGIGLLVDRR
ncbi:hypothetical protein N0V90_007672 [Kalmusia sp. IMI 367209]|nr:hypothetical protein N0V90_007672 [Kalmusia sp. IMI 367209]